VRWHRLAAQRPEAQRQRGATKLRCSGLWVRGPSATMPYLPVWLAWAR
jgi:hypothetical protein